MASGESGHVVEAMNEFGVEVRSSKKPKAVKLRASVSIGGTRVAAEERDRHSTFREGRMAWCARARVR